MRRTAKASLIALPVIGVAVWLAITIRMEALARRDQPKLAAFKRRCRVVDAALLSLQHDLKTAKHRDEVWIRIGEAAGSTYGEISACALDDEDRLPTAIDACTQRRDAMCMDQTLTKIRAVIRDTIDDP